jgi:hypothetical protein
MLLIRVGSPLLTASRAGSAGPQDTRGLSGVAELPSCP